MDSISEHHEENNITNKSNSKINKESQEKCEGKELSHHSENQLEYHESFVTHSFHESSINNINQETVKLLSPKSFGKNSDKEEPPEFLTIDKGCVVKFLPESEAEWDYQ